MARRPVPPDESQVPNDFPATEPKTDRADADKWFVMVETGKIMTNVEHILERMGHVREDLKDFRTDLTSMRNQGVAALVAIALAGIGAVIWANTKIEAQEAKLADLDKRVALIQKDIAEIEEDTKAMRDDVKEIKAAVTSKR